MAKFNSDWVLKFSVLRQVLLMCSGLNPSKEQFINTIIIELSYPVGFQGPRYFNPLHCVDLKSYFENLPENTIIKTLNSHEKSRLYSYYHLDLSYYGYSK